MNLPSLLEMLAEEIPSDSLFVIQVLAKEYLYKAMTFISLKYTGLPWTKDNEYAIWRAIVDGPIVIEEDEIRELEKLADLADGWWVTNPSSDLLTFVDKDTWETTYANYRTSTESAIDRPTLLPTGEE